MPEVTLANSDMWDLRSRAGRSYRIFVSKPAGEPGPGGFPVLYLLDGNASFAIAAASAALQARRPESTQVSPAVIVGIGYPVDDYLDAVSRSYDYTPAVAVGDLPPRPDGSPWPTTGGAAAFLEFIESELKPRLEREFAIDKSREAIFGHSFGGLFALHTLFTRPESFRFYVAASPSIWFAKRLILDRMDGFILSRRAGAIRRNLLVTVGSLEGARADTPAFDAGASLGDQWRRRNRMVENAADIVRRLESAGGAALNVAFKEFDDENHSSVLPAAISRALRFALAPPTRP